MKRVLLFIGVCGLGCSFDSGDAGDTESENTTSSMEDSTGSELTGGVTTASASGTSSGTTDAPTTDPTGDTETTAPGSSTTSEEETEESTEGSSSSGGPSFVLCDDGDANLSACYDFAEVEEGVLTDRSMYGNDGTANNVAVEPGPFGDAVRCGPEAEISIPDSDSLDVEGPATWEAWVYVDALPTTGRVGILDNDSQYSMMLYADQGMRCNGGGLNVFAPEVPAGQWVHLACVYDQNELTAWVDGEVGASGGGGAPIATASDVQIAIGDTSPDFVAPLDGLVGGVRVWSVARSQDELTEAAAAAAR